MSNVSIYDKNWIDLVFDGRNKEYGAYQLRQQDSRTSLMAFFTGISFLGGIIGLGMLVMAFNTDKGLEMPVDPIAPEGLHVTEVVLLEKEIMEKPNTDATPPPAEVKPNLFANFIPVETPLANNEVPTNSDIPPTTGSTSNNGTEAGTATGTDTGSTAGTATTGTGSGETPNGNATVTTNVLDVMPEYPGGIDEFHKYIGKNIDRPEVDDNTTAVTAIVSFVIEKDGSLTDIKVLRSTNKDLEKAAIKVLRALRTKWKPGIKDGQYVRTLYVQPIRVRY